MDRPPERAPRPDAGSETDVSLAARLERLAVEERAAVRERDWALARSKAEERAVLREAHHRLAARRWA